MYDYVIVGAGLTGCVLARKLKNWGKKVLIVEKRNHIAGNCHDYHNDDGILVHKYGPHFFHTNNKRVWNHLSDFTDWNYYQHRALIYVDGQYLPFPLAAGERYALSKIYEGYTEKQWGKYADKIDKGVIERVQQRKEEGDDRYFTDKYQAMPNDSYTEICTRMTAGISILLNTEYDQNMSKLFPDAKVIFTGRLDAYYGFSYGTLPFRSVWFQHVTHDKERRQEVAQINYPCDYDFTRSVEIKHATGQKHHKTTVVYEYPKDVGDPFYPVPCKESDELQAKYKALADRDGIILIGRLAENKYYNMDEVILNALELADKLCMKN